MRGLGRLLASVSVLALAACETVPGEGAGRGAFVVTALGDVAFAGNRYLNTAKSKSEWAKYTDALEPLLIGDANFINLEAVVTEESLGEGRDKEFTFQMHTTALAHLIEDLNVNLISTANNHSGDFGRAGQMATLEALDAHKDSIAHHGVGTDEALSTAAEHTFAGQKVALAAIGISSASPRPAGDKPGQWNVGLRRDWNRTLDALSNSEASFRVLSVHEGIERQSSLEAGVKKRFRGAQTRADIDLILAHHPHVPRGLEMNEDGQVIAFGLGNALLHGAANLAGRGVAQDFGLMLRLYYRTSSEGPVLEALEAVPLTGMHRAPRPVSASEARLRVMALNALSTQASGERALILEPDTDTGFGLWCDEAPTTKRAKALCD